MFGPQPRSYGFRLPGKVKRGAIVAALAQRIQDGALVVVDALSATESKTKAATELLKRLGADGKALLIDVQPDEKLGIAVRNLRRRAVSRERPRRRARRDERVAE